MKRHHDLFFRNLIHWLWHLKWNWSKINITNLIKISRLIFIWFLFTFVFLGADIILHSQRDYNRKGVLICSGNIVSISVVCDLTLGNNYLVDQLETNHWKNDIINFLDATVFKMKTALRKKFWRLVISFLID